MVLLWKVKYYCFSCLKMSLLKIILRKKLLVVNKIFMIGLFSVRRAGDGRKEIEFDWRADKIEAMLCGKYQKFRSSNDILCLAGIRNTRRR